MRNIFTIGIWIFQSAPGTDEKERKAANILIISTLGALLGLFFFSLHTLGFSRFFPLLGILLSCTAIVLGLRQVWLQRRMALATYQWNKNRATLEYVSAFTDKFQDFLRENSTFDAKSGSFNINPVDLTRIADLGYYGPYRRFFNYWECFAVGIHLKIYDAKTGYQSARALLQHAFEICKPVRDELKSHTPKAFIMLEGLAGEWKKKYDSAQQAAQQAHHEEPDGNEFE